jgi:hypothetical protein
LLSAGAAQREEMLLRGGDLEKADLFPWFVSIRTRPWTREDARPQAAVNRRSLRAEGDPTADHQSRPARTPRLPVALILLAAFVLGACVQSKTPLRTGSKQLLGERFQLNTFQDFTEGKAVTVKTGVYRWSATRYALVSGNVSDVKFPSIQPLDDNEFLIEATDDNDYAYLLAHKLTDRTYRLLPINEKNLDAATQKRLCVAQDSNTCTIATRDALDTFAPASVGKTVPYSMVAVISGAAAP